MCKIFPWFIFTPLCIWWYSFSCTKPIYVEKVVIAFSYGGDVADNVITVEKERKREREWGSKQFPVKHIRTIFAAIWMRRNYRDVCEWYRQQHRDEFYNTQNLPIVRIPSISGILNYFNQIISHWVERRGLIVYTRICIAHICPQLDKTIRQMNAISVCEWKEGITGWWRWWEWRWGSVNNEVWRQKFRSSTQNK